MSSAAKPQFYMLFSYQIKIEYSYILKCFETDTSIRGCMCAYVITSTTVSLYSSKTRVFNSYGESNHFISKSKRQVEYR